MNSVERMVEASRGILDYYTVAGRDWLALTIAVIRGKSPIKLSSLPVDEPGGPRGLLEINLSCLPEPVLHRVTRDNEDDLVDLDLSLVDRVGSLLIVRYMLNHYAKASMNPDAWPGLFADVCDESSAWGPTAPDVVALAAALAKQIDELALKPAPMFHQPKPLRKKLTRIEATTRKLELYSKSNNWKRSITVVDPADGTNCSSAAAEMADPPAVGKESQRGSRRTGPAAGGRPRTYTHPRLVKSLAAWEKQRKKARSAGERFPKWADWLSGYCGDHSIDPKHELPEKYPGEPWDKRADRLKEALKRREGRPERGTAGEQTPTNSGNGRTLSQRVVADIPGHPLAQGQQTPSLLP